MVQNPPCWRASCALGHPKQRKCKFVLMKSLCSGCPSGQLALQHGGFCTMSDRKLQRAHWNLEMLAFEERGKPEYPEKNLSEQGREPTTNSTHIWCRVRESNPSHIGGRPGWKAKSQPLRHPCSPKQRHNFTVFVIYFISNFL